MAKPPAGSSLLFGALADSARIKQRQNGSYRMVLRGIDHIDWFTDRPDRVAGEWSPKKFVRKWNRLFGDVEPNAQATFSAPLREEYENTELNYITTSIVGSKRELVTFEMFKPRFNDLRQKLSFKIRGIGKKNKDLLTGLRNEQLSDASLFIDESLPSCLPNCDGANLTNANLSYADLENANLAGADLSNADLSGAKMGDADLSSADLSGAKLEYSDLIGTNLSKANLKNANLFNAFMYGALLEGANLTDANLEYALLEGANLNGANLTEASLENADLERANHDRTILVDANLSYAQIGEASLDNANLTGADMTNTVLGTGPYGSLVKWNNSTCPDGTVIKDVNEFHSCPALQLLLA